MKQLHQRKRSESSLSDEWDTRKDFYEPIPKTETHFLHNGNNWYINYRGEKKDIDVPRNGYFVVIWRKRS